MPIPIYSPLIVPHLQPTLPSAEHPFVVLTQAGQPVRLLAHRPFSGQQPPVSARTAALIILMEKTVHIELLERQARIALDNTPDAEGIVLLDTGLQIQGVMATADVLSSASNDWARGLSSLGYEPLPGPDPDVSASQVYVCPIPGCTSPEVVIQQKGQEVPPCPEHHVPRVLKAPSEPNP